MAEVSQSLRDAFGQHGDAPEHREPIIVTIEPDASLPDLSGFEVQHVTRSGTIVLGRASLAAVELLATLDVVTRVEHESGDMRALD